MGLITSAALGYDAEMLSAAPGASIHASVAPIVDEQRALMRGGGGSSDFMSRPPMGQNYQMAEQQQQPQAQKSQNFEGAWQTPRRPTGQQSQGMVGVVGGSNGGGSSGGSSRLMRDRNGATAMRQRPAVSLNPHRDVVNTI